MPNRRDLLALIVLSIAAVPLGAQCPDGSPPPCAGAAPMRLTLNPDRIAILPFRTSGADPALAYLRDGMVDLLAAEFNGDGAPAAAEPGTAIRAWARTGGGETGDRVTALRVARGLGAGQVMLGAVVGTPRRLYISATIVGVPSGDVRVPQVRVEGSADSLSNLISGLMARLVSGRSGVWRLSANDPGTTSNEALHAYLTGRAAYRTGDYTQAAAAFRRALALDSSFVLAAYNMLLVGQWNAGAVTDADVGAMIRIAYAGRARLGVLDQELLTTFSYFTDAGPPVRADWLAAARRAVALEPLSNEAQFRLGDVLFHSGEALGIRDAPAAAAAALDASVALDTTADPLMHLVELAVARGDTAAARRYGAVLARMAPTTDILWRRWLAAEALGDSTAARLTWNQPLARTTGFNAFAVTVALRTGMPAAAAQALARAHALAATDEERRAADDAELRYLVNTGQRAAARQMAARQARLGLTLLLGTELTDSASVVAAARAYLAGGSASAPRASPHESCSAALQLAPQGDTAAVRLLMGAPPDSAFFMAQCAVAARAIAVVALGGPLAALESADSLLRRVSYGWDGELPFHVAQMFARRGRYAEAARAVLPARDGNDLLRAASLRDAARYAALAGDTAIAVDAAQRYLRLRVDPDSEVVAERDSVRALLVRLERR